MSSIENEEWFPQHYKYLGKEGRSLIIQCLTCLEDTELFGDAIFKVERANLRNGHLPCGCSRGVRWTPEQYLVKIQRLLSESKYTLVGYESDFNGNESRVIIDCPDHGQWSSYIMNIVGGRRCKQCMYDRPSPKRKSENHFIKRFLESGSYPEGTTFKMKERITVNESQRIVWSVYCPICEITAEALTENLVKGKRCCSCFSPNQQYAYIHEIHESHNESPIAIKFGISFNVDKRVKEQQNKAHESITVHNIGVWKFTNAESCRSAEKECKRSIDRKYLSKDILPDGYTETTCVQNKDLIISIYEKHGAVKESFLEQ